MLTLNSFFVFNSSYGPREGEVKSTILYWSEISFSKLLQCIFLYIYQEIKKVLYFYPPSADENTKCKDVGLAEAMVKFME